jgi:YNFM family putative membrane transporter
MTDTLPAGFRRGTPEFRRVIVALMAGGFSTFALLYCAQPLLPEFAGTFGQTAASASLAVSLATGTLAGSLLFTGVIADRIDRRRMMVASLVAAAILTLLVSIAPSWHLLLLARALTGIALSGVPAVALTYVGEEVDVASVGLAVGLHIGGNVFGGMGGRLITGVLADHFGWRAAVGAIGVVGLVCAGLLWLTLPASRRFTPRSRTFATALGGLVRPWGDRGLPWLFLESFLCMGSFVAVYNYIGFRLLAPPYGLSQTVVGLIFTCYLLGIVSSAWVGDLAGRLGRRKVYWAPIAAMAAGVALTGFSALPLVILGVAVLTFAFFGAHSTASSWVGRRSPGMRAEASSLFLFFYYLGGSIVGTLSGFAWGHFGWSGVVALLEGLLGLALAVAIGLAFLKPLPGNEPGAQKSGS